jgi:hypothetical protein
MIRYPIGKCPAKSEVGGFFQTSLSQSDPAASTTLLPSTLAPGTPNRVIAFIRTNCPTLLNRNALCSKSCHLLERVRQFFPAEFCSLNITKFHNLPKIRQEGAAARGLQTKLNDLRS